MKSAVAWCARNPVASNLLMWLMVMGGLLSAVSVLGWSGGRLLSKFAAGSGHSERTGDAVVLGESGG